VTRYNIRDDKGVLQAVHVREDVPEGKRVWWEQPDGTKGLNGRPVASLPLYGSEEVPLWPLEEVIMVTEGEKAMEALASIGFCVLGTVTGAATCPDVPSVEAVAKDRLFCLWPDHDDAGREHMARMASTLYEAGARKVWIIHTDGLTWPKGADSADFVGLTPSEGFEEFRGMKTERIKALVSRRAHLVSKVAVVSSHREETTAKVRPLRLIHVSGGNVGVTAESLAAQLQRVRSQPGGGYVGRCPSHDDRVASLSFTENDEGRLLLYCHAGCTFEQVMAAVR